MTRRFQIISDSQVIDKRTGREYWRPMFGGYIREIDSSHAGFMGRQVCARLRRTGSTLYCDENTALVKVLRRETR
jgi:hypothetical protein